MPDLDDQVHHRDKGGRPLALLEWADLFQNLDYRRVAETQVGGTLVRTVWEGIDDGVQVGCMWATGVGNAEALTTTWEGYWPCTQEEAKAAHEKVVATLRERQATPSI
ncbi:hypothetical protein AB0M10_15290 [Streptomyces sp. NPDC051840]|uniref:hypothetical protein n=1 Tax=Streptomyces sp. NPDC051840 TaxID=3154752 RepID=UPI0034222CB4